MKIGHDEVSDSRDAGPSQHRFRPIEALGVRGRYVVEGDKDLQ